MQGSLSESVAQQLDALFAGEVAQERSAGYFVSVAKGSKVVYQKQFGYADRESKAPFTDDTKFKIFSLTKIVSSVAAMMLVERGRLSLDDPVSKYIPAFAAARVFAGEGKEPVPVERAVLVRHLLTHTAGLFYTFPGLAPDLPEDVRKICDAAEAAENKAASLVEFANIMATTPLIVQPGTQWIYSPATIVVGAVVEAASGVPFAEFLDRNIFQPLHMHNTAFHLAKEKLSLLATHYEQRHHKLVRMEDKEYTSTAPPSCPRGDSGLISTLADYTRFGMMLANGGELDGVRIVKKATVDDMMMPHLPDGVVFPYPHCSFSFGGIRVADLAFGWSGIYQTHFRLMLQSGITIVMMQQTSPFDESINQKAVEILAAEP